MKIPIKQATKLSNKLLKSFGFTDEEARLCTELFIEGELVGKASHGLIRLVKLKKMIDDGRVEVNDKRIEIVAETKLSILVDGKRKTGFYVAPKTLELAFEKMKSFGIGILAAGGTNTSPAAGMIGYYARRACEKELIYIGFHNSMSYLVPFGAKKALWGTNPVTIGVPSNDVPVIWDSSSSKISVGDILVARQEGKKLPKDVALDKDGNPTQDPVEALDGGVLPFATHKGSGMAFIVELLAGALVDSSISKDAQWNWGAFFVLIDPSMFRPIEVFKKQVQASIKELKSLPKAEGVKEVYYPGERSQKLRLKHLKKGKFEISDKLYEELKGLERKR